MTFFPSPVPKSGSAIIGWPAVGSSSAAEQCRLGPRYLPLFCCDVSAALGQTPPIPSSH